MLSCSPIATPSRSSTHRWRTPGTCGELLQGHLDGRDFMVNCPIDLYATAEASISGGTDLAVSDPFHFRKVIATLRHLASTGPEAQDRLRQGVSLRIDSPIPRCKGMASSTADASCALAAVAACAGIELDEATAARLLTAVEPSDCTHFQGIAHLDFLKGELIERLPVPQGLHVLVVDCGGEVETLAFDRERARAIYAEHRDRLRRALEQLKRGLRERSNAWVGRAATVSTQLSQMILPKKGFQDLQILAPGWNLAGINCAHSGTVLGLLYQNDRPDKAEWLRDQVKREFGQDLPILGTFRIVGGGNHAV